jgi:hypothetical protein
VRTLLAAVLFLLTTSLSAYTTGFEPPVFVLGDVNGQDGWGHLSNSPTDGFIEPVPAGSPAMFGTQSLAIRTRNVDFFGVSNHLYSATIEPAAGETGSTAGGTAVVDPQSHFAASFWYRTPDVPVVSTRADGRIAELNPSSKGGTAGDPANRYAQVRVFNDAGGLVRVEIGWYTSSTFTFTTAVVGFLEWGQWYRFDFLIQLVDGLDGNAPNDRFNLTVFDGSGAQVGSACGSTWEAAYKTGSFGGGTTPRAIDGFDFWSVTGPNGTLVGFLDELTMSAFTPAQATLGVTIGGNANVCFGATTTLTANATGGGGTITSYTWRDSGNNVVGTNATFDAGPGTFTVTVTDSLCTIATSAPFAVTQSAALAVSISGANSVCCGQTTPLQANVAGGSGTVSGYAWRNAANEVVGTDATFDAVAGTYTVTVTDASCGNATSAPFTVAQAPSPAAIPTASDGVLLLLAVSIAGAALLRMR